MVHSPVCLVLDDAGSGDNGNTFTFFTVIYCSDFEESRDAEEDSEDGDSDHESLHSRSLSNGPVLQGLAEGEVSVYRQSHNDPHCPGVGSIGEGIDKWIQ